MKIILFIGAFFFGYYVAGSLALSLGAASEFSYPFGILIGSILAYLYYNSEK